jgi:hypothetical protein
MINLRDMMMVLRPRAMRVRAMRRITPTAEVSPG